MIGRRPCLQPRREFLGRCLRAAGVTVALPWLPSLLPRAARAAATPPPRLVVWFMPNGRFKERWEPTQTGATYTMPETMAPLAPLQADLSVLSGLQNAAALQSEGLGDHAKGTSTVLTGTPIKGASSAHSVSLDQLLVQKLPYNNAFPSLQWGCGQPNVCDAAAPCVDTQVLSWTDGRTPLPPICDAQSAFDQLFGGDDPGLTAAQRQQRKQSKRSMLDYVLQDANGMRARANAPDGAKLDEYLTAVRALEKQLDAAAGSCATAGEPGMNLGYAEQVQAFSDLMVLALQCDQTRIITFMIEFGLSLRSHPFLDAPVGHHALSHFGNEGERQQLFRVETWQVQQAANFAGRLKKTPDSDGKTLLDNTALLILPSMGTGAVHDHGDMCAVVVGRAGGALHPGTHRNFNKNVPLANLHLGLLAAFGVMATGFGSTSSAALTDL